jgi:hypothetical protein
MLKDSQFPPAGLRDLLLIAADARMHDLTIEFIDKGRAPSDRVAGGSAPFYNAGGHIDSVQLVIKTADIDGIAADGGAGIDTVTDGGAPLFSAGDGVERIEVMIEAAGIDNAIADRGAGLDATTGGSAPFL